MDKEGRPFIVFALIGGSALLLVLLVQAPAFMGLLLAAGGFALYRWGKHQEESAGLLRRAEAHDRAVEWERQRRQSQAIVNSFAHTLFQAITDEKYRPTAVRLDQHAEAGRDPEELVAFLKAVTQEAPGLPIGFQLLLSTLPSSDPEDFYFEGSNKRDREHEARMDRMRRFNALQSVRSTLSLPIPVNLTEQKRTEHLYMIGKTSSGKTTFLQNMILRDLENGEGIAVLTPDPDLITEGILPFVPSDRVDDVIYFDPTEEQRPIPLNPLYIDEGEDHELRVDDNLTIFQRTMGDTSPRMEAILRHSVRALLSRPGSTLLDIPKLLDPLDASFRLAILPSITNEQTRYFFETTYPSYSGDPHLPIINRLDALIGSEKTKRILCHPSASLNIRKAMDERRILLFNLSDGILGAPTAQLIGQLLISKLQLAAVSRADTSSAERTPFYLYVDEFQAFTGVAAGAYESLMNRARKYGIGLALAHQQTGQLPASLFAEVIRNAGTLVSLAVGYDDATKFAREFRCDPKELQDLEIPEAYCKVGKHVGRFFRYNPADDHEPNEARAREVVARSREQWGAVHLEAESEDRAMAANPQATEDYLE